MASSGESTNEARTGPKIGFEAPYSSEQIGTTIGQPIVYIIFLTLCATHLSGSTQGLVIALHLLLSAFIICCWYKCSHTDPSVDVVTNLGLPVPKKEPRYCNTCKITVAGMDHHCKYLNICIGSSTYGYFMWLTIAATVQFVMQSIVSFNMARTWYDDVNSHFGIEGYVAPDPFKLYGSLLGLYSFAAINLGIAIAYGSLLAFHIYLMKVRECGTYDWLLSRQSLPTTDTTSAENGKVSTATAPTKVVDVQPKKNWITSRLSASTNASKYEVSSPEAAASPEPAPSSPSDDKSGSDVKVAVVVAE